MTGRVVLVGAGPGAPDLLTLRGERALRAADAVVYDSLAPSELLDLAPEAAERIDVGKRGHDAPTRDQSDINALLVSLARGGKNVVRLKGGDPFVFGRGGEEVRACAEAGVAVEVVPGVSSVTGALAYAGIALTDREASASFAVFTGHKDPTRVREELRIEELARAADTLVILMGMRNLAEITSRLLAGGRSAQTPSAVVMQGTLPGQRVLEAPLGELAERAQEAGLRAPAAVVVGEVVRLRQRPAWFEALPLFGKRVLVTRPENQAGPLVRALLEAGAEPVRVPLIRIEPIQASAEIEAAVGELASFDAVLLSSGNAARQYAARLRERGHDPAAGPACLCVGPTTEEAARSASLPVASLVRESDDAQGLLAALRGRSPVAGRRFLLPRAEKGRELLAEGLRADGAEVASVPVYRTEPVPFDGPALADDLAAGRIDALIFASPSAVHAFAAGVGPAGRDAARNAIVCAIGSVTAAALREAGLPPQVVPERPDVRSLVEQLAGLAANRAGASS